MHRRTFLKGAALSAVALRTGLVDGSVIKAATPEFPTMASHLLNQVNFERAEAGVSTLKLDSLACSVAEKHATEMARHDFISHWGLDGRKPYHRHSFAGGVDAIQENGGALNISSLIPSEEVPIHLMSMHRSMHDEVPPKDGHRKTILNPNHTHVGFGYANSGYCVRLCELYVARYVTVDPLAAIVPVRSKFVFSGRLLESSYTIKCIDVFYEPPPAPPALNWLRVPRPYGLPEERESLFPKLPPETIYADGSKGTIEMLEGLRFKTPIQLSRKQPGIYTIVVWISRSPGETPFPATEVCVRAE